MNRFIDYLEHINLFPHQKIELMVLTAQTLETLGDAEFKFVAVFLREGKYIPPSLFPEEILKIDMDKWDFMEVLKWVTQEIKAYQRQPTTSDDQAQVERICDLFLYLKYNSSFLCLLKFCLKRFEFNPELEYHAMIEQWQERTRFHDKPFDSNEFQERVLQQVRPPFYRSLLEWVPLNAWQFLAIGEWAFSKVQPGIMGMDKFRFASPSAATKMDSEILSENN